MSAAGNALYSLFSIAMLAWIVWLFVKDRPRRESRDAERLEFEAWLLREQMLEATWDAARNCYAEFPAHLAWRAWVAARPASRIVRRRMDRQRLIENAERAMREWSRR